MKRKNIGHEVDYHITKKKFENFENCANYDFFSSKFCLFLKSHSNFSCGSIFLKIRIYHLQLYIFQPMKENLGTLNQFTSYTVCPFGKIK